MYQITRLSNGLTIATAEMPHMVSVSLGVWVATGARYESAEENGAAHFIEHMLFKGTKARTARQISEDVEGVGGYLNAFTGEESTCFFSKALADRFDDLLEVLMDMFLNSKFDPAEIEKERGVIKEEVAMYNDQPQQLVHELLNQTMWPDQPLGRPITGTNTTLDFLDRDRLGRFLQAHYVTGSTLVVAAGNIRHRQVSRAVARYARHVTAGTRTRYAPAMNGQHTPRLRLHTKPTEQTQIALGIRTCSRHDDRRHALRILNAILGENMSSRLFQIVREEHGLAYSIYSVPSFFDDTGDLVISAGLDDGNVTRALKLILAELRRLRTKPPTAAELRRAHDYVIGQLDLSLEGTDAQMNWMGDHLIGHGQIISAREAKQRFAAVTRGEVRAVAADFFKPANLNLAAVTPRKRDPGLTGLLGSLL